MPSLLTRLTPFALLALAACTTPLQQCLSQARAQQSALSAQIQTAQGNINRGYAIHTQSVPYTYVGVCYADDGSSYSCEQNGTRTEETPVAIDVAEERRKLAQLKRDLAAITPAADAAAAQCQLQYPE